jgi:hypothetical protein
MLPKRRSALSLPRIAIAWLVALAAVCAVGAYPKPAAVPYRWELNFEAGDLRLFQDSQSGESYWYFVYKVTNRTGKDQTWAPSLVLFTDTGEILEAGRGVPSRVTDELLALLGNELLEDQNEVIGDLLQGKEHAKEGMVVWPAKNLKVNELSLFVAGISGEVARVKNPVTGQEVFLRKTLQRDYLIPGEAAARGSKPIDLAAETWVMR